MGLFDFVKAAGRMIGIGDDAPDADALKKAVDEHGFETTGLEISVDGDKAVVKGTAKSQEEKEKIILALGNNKGIGSVAEEITVEAPEPEATFYTVKSGDTLSHIAKDHYGSANKYMTIFNANRPMLSDPDKIYPGQVLRIPADG